MSINKKEQKRLRRAKLIFKHLMIKQSRQFGEMFFATVVVSPDSLGMHLPLTAIFAEKGPSEPEIIPC